MNNIPLTKKRFERVLKKIFTTPKDAQEVKRTSDSRLSDDYSGKRKSRDKTEDKKD